mmetsp:Transcript_53784/g.128152  ORF Transcript_53784/g.128152 Transcript_53784/m.128152 type:complete len:410 (+) Transcript_53784:108-1337(+)|eukprot:CAMPEP_0178442008 /NCGR_PEP_ID=MMETSP0689_2-20121128/37884_1 /TAXON_ID=160604 /ORGANISM="Amphidinium massartii, Strain CS-259" /LENGTH=409 /DNA_ID=CAMNT_0020065423 /DNA_START=22 /DNA_END=1251 /DNA_ORIENTATION=+
MSLNDELVCGLTKRQWGVVVAVVGILWASPDSLCIRLASEEQPGRGCVLFYRYCFKALATSIGLLFVCGGPRGLAKSCMATGWHFVAASIAEGTSEALFTLSIQTTSVANTLVLVNASPLWCAILGCLVFGEKPPLHTLATLLLGFGCVLVVFFGAREASASGNESIFGDVLGLLAGFVLAVFLTICRHAGLKHPDANMVPSIMASAFLSAIIALFWSHGRVGEQCWPESGFTGWAYVATNGAVLMPIAFVCLATAPKYLLSAEVAMIMLLEVLLGPLLVWVFIGEAPSQITVFAGTTLVMLLGAHEYYASRSSRALPPAESSTAEKAAPDSGEQKVYGAPEQEEQSEPGSEQQPPSEEEGECEEAEEQEEGEKEAVSRAAPEAEDENGSGGKGAPLAERLPGPILLQM